MSGTQLNKNFILEGKRRTLRLLNHCFIPWKDPYLGYKLRTRNYLFFLFHYLVEIPLLSLDCIGMPEWFAFLQFITKKNARKLHDHELKLANEIFQHRMDFSNVMIDEASRVGTQGGKYAFVTYNYINCIGQMTLPIVIHELVHVVQFKQDGSRYAIRNLIAHLKQPTYDYGGLERIMQIVNAPDQVHSLNYEQRADVFSDYCRLLLGQRPEWGNARLQDAIYYYKVIKMMMD